jgi:hypothetical protein
MSKESKTKALEKHLGNNIGYCPKCEKKHPKGKHDSEKSEKDEYNVGHPGSRAEEKTNKKEINGDQE